MRRFVLACLVPAALLLGNRAVFAADRVESLLQALTEAPGPSGYEEAVRAIVVRELKPLSSRITYDGLGSVIAETGAQGPRIMLDAHMDEVGAIVRRITPDGFLTLQFVGGWMDQALPDQRWTILGSKGSVHAVTGIRDAHVASSSEFTHVFGKDQIFVDVGVRSAAEVASLGVDVGDPVAPDSPFLVMNGQHRYSGKALDDRVGCAVAIEVMRNLVREGHPNIVFAAATVQEEVGLKGAQTAATMIRPEVGIAIEGAVSGEVPGAGPEESQGRLGGGPSVTLYDGNEQPNRRLIALIKDVAKRTNTPLQFDLVKGYGDDSGPIQLSNGGVPTVNIAVPVRYMHAHNGVMDRSDFDQTVTLVTELIRALDQNTVAGLRDFAR